jgi:hypothetical protein
LLVCRCLLTFHFAVDSLAAIGEGVRYKG